MGTQLKCTCSHDVFLEINLVLLSMLPNKVSLFLFKKLLYCKKQATPLIAVELIIHVSFEVVWESHLESITMDILGIKLFR